ncbi:hypothetical protein [Dactylosporangium darangshiense]|uniref:hypothetical protein n=1 Tax=Dactylosporangium darangshiense TaxID=579108 RepID=UPI003634172A
MRKHAVALFFLAPLIAEFLLGDFGLNALYALLILAPMYGGGAILVRSCPAGPAAAGRRC